VGSARDRQSPRPAELNGKLSGIVPPAGAPVGVPAGALITAASVPLARGAPVRVMYAQSGRSEPIGFDLLADDPLPTPLPTGIVNGDFAVGSPADPAFGWQINGEVTVGSAQALIREGAALFADLSQTFTIPAAAHTLRLTLTPGFQESAGETLPEAVEVALLSQTDASPVLGPMKGLNHSDALLNLQADGTLWLASGATIVSSRPVHSGSTVYLGDPIQVLVTLPPALSGTAVTLYLDLIGSGATQSTLTVAAVDSRDREAFVLRLSPGWNAFALPINVEDPSVAAVLAAVAFAQPVWAYDPLHADYVPAASLLPGRGYLLLARQAAGITLFGTSPAADWSHLEAGWNLLGSPDGTRPPGADSSLGQALWMQESNHQTNRRAPLGVPLDPATAYWYWLDPSP
jgi:hypothetical protein